VRAAPARELPPEKAAEATVLVPLAGTDAASLRRRRRRPDGWVPVHLGVVARTKTDGRTQWLEGEHASHWAWPELDQARAAMSVHRTKGSTVLLLALWSPVWTGDLVEVGSPEHHDPYVRSLCWTLMSELVPDSWAPVGRRSDREPLQWRHRQPGAPEQFAL
jgi:hypothetical protein